MKLKVKKPQVRNEKIEARCTQKEKRLIQRKAKLYGVSVSEWVRYASMNYLPSGEELE